MMLRQWLATVSLLAVIASQSEAQWRLGVELSTYRYGGTAHDTSDVTAKPGNATTLSLRIAKAFQNAQQSLRISFARTGFFIGNGDVSIADKTTGMLLEAAALTAFRVGGIGPSGAVKFELGPALHLWDFNGEFRARAGALGALAYEWPVASRFGGAIRLEGGVSKSWFNADEVPPEFERRLTWRDGVSLGLNYRL